uniref:Fibroblast growth factor n=1 Tax=Phallusia mammillata TaxID=59560 RepID=A0A6F9DDM6_9ASCI|nr:Fgf3/7/10/22 fibroblast growth factor 3/7/10/22 [Phallusia mammillata]
MSTNLGADPLLKLLQPTTIRGLLKTLTSLVRHRTEIIAALYIALIVLGCCLPVAAELSYRSPAMDRRQQNALVQRLRSARTDFAAAKHEKDATAQRCRSCQHLRYLTSLLDVTTPTSSPAGRLLRAQIKRTARACGDMTYEQLRRLCRPAAKNTQDEVTSQRRDMTSLTERLLSRKKRLASDGDVRLRSLVSKTGYYLEMLPNGRVRSSKTQTQNTILKILAVGRVGVVSIYSVVSKKYLAMTDDGYLFGSSIYIPTACNFVEVLRGSMYSTYHSLALPKGKRRRRHKAYFVGIGKSGKVRKGSRVNESHQATWMLATSL